MKSFHDPRPVCALPFSLSGPAYAARLRRVTRSVGRQHHSSAPPKVAVSGNAVQIGDNVFHIEDGALVYRGQQAQPCVVAKSWRKADLPDRPNLYDKLAAEFGTTRAAIKEECYRYFYSGDHSTAHLVNGQPLEKRRDALVDAIRAHLRSRGFVSVEVKRATERLAALPPPAAQKKRSTADWLADINREIREFLNAHVGAVYGDNGKAKVPIVAFCLPKGTRSLAALEAELRACPKRGDLVRSRQDGGLVAGNLRFLLWRDRPANWKPPRGSRLVSVSPEADEEE